MKIVKWAVVVLEALNILMALGTVPSSTENGGQIGLIVGALVTLLCLLSLRNTASLPRASTLGV